MFDGVEFLTNIYFIMHHGMLLNAFLISIDINYLPFLCYFLANYKHLTYAYYCRAY